VHIYEWWYCAHLFFSCSSGVLSSSGAHYQAALLPSTDDGPAPRDHGGIRPSVDRCCLVMVAARPGMVRSSAYGGSGAVGLDLAPGWREVATAEWTRGWRVARWALTPFVLVCGLSFPFVASPSLPTECADDCVWSLTNEIGSSTYFECSTTNYWSDGDAVPKSE